MSDEQTQENKPAPEDLATHDFQTLLPRFYDKVEELSNRQLKRVVTALIEYPLERTDFRFSYVKEAEAFDLGMRIMDAKFIIMKTVMELTLDQQKELKAELDALSVKEAEELKVVNK